MSEELREPLPRNGVWTIEDLAGYLDTNASQLEEKLKELNIPVLRLGNRHKLKLIRIEDLYVGKSK